MASGFTSEAGAPDSKRVLLIDDDDAVRKVFARILKNGGFQPLLAENGQRGLDLFRETSPDAVLMDLNMPGLSGLDVLSAVTAQAPDIPAIVISGTDAMDDVVQALRRGAWDYVTKPVHDPRYLIRALCRALERSSLIRENREQRERVERLNRELTIAVDELRSDQEAGRRIQFQLLPSEGLRIGNYRFTRRLFPSQYLSGDFIDYFPVGGDHLAFYIADVSGHGAASAFVTAMLATLVARHLEAFARGESAVVLSPGRLLTSLNQELGLQRFRKHVTMFYAVIDLRAQRLTCSSAGQYPFPLLEGADGVSVLETSGRPLGLFTDSQYTQRQVELGSVRRLLLASDGVLEILPAVAGETRIDRLAAIFREASDIEALVRALGVDPADRRPDDVTLLLVEREFPHA